MLQKAFACGVPLLMVLGLSKWRVAGSPIAYSAETANAELDTVGCVLGSKQVGYNHCGAAALFLLDSSVVATKGAADPQPNKFKLY